MASYRWIFFDLFDTLCTVDEERYYEGKRRAAEVAGVDAEAFLDAWRSTSKAASVGRLRTPFERAAVALQALGVRDRTAVADVARLDVETIQESVFFYEGARETLQVLRERGFQLGLISNATATTAFAVASLRLRDRLDLLVFSYEVGLVKPDLGIFELALSRASCPAGEALFVGDGANGELDAAAALGLATLCLDHPLKAHSFRDSQTLSGPGHPRVTAFADLVVLPDLQGPHAQ